MIYSLGEKTPRLDPDIFIARSADLIGDVRMAKGSSAWFNATLRADTTYINVGEDSNIQDNVAIHVTGETMPVNIHKGVTVGHSAVIHGATLLDYAFIGMGAIVLDGAVVESHGFVAAGALVPPGFRVPSRKLVAGIPAKIIRDITPEEIEMIERNASLYAAKAWLMQKNLKPVSL